MIWTGAPKLLRLACSVVGPQGFLIIMVMDSVGVSEPDWVSVRRSPSTVTRGGE